MNPQTIAFQGETQLLRWSDTSNGGATITLALSDPADLEKFKLMTQKKGKQAGQRLMTAMVEIGDDEQPVVQDVLSSKPGQLCIMACTFCADPDFQHWIHSFHTGACTNESEAKQFILDTCHVGSRKDIDLGDLAANVFHRSIRLPFLEWKAQP